MDSISQASPLPPNRQCVGHSRPPGLSSSAPASLTLIARGWPFENFSRRVTCGTVPKHGRSRCFQPSRTLKAPSMASQPRTSTSMKSALGTRLPTSWPDAWHSMPSMSPRSSQLRHPCRLEPSRRLTEPCRCQPPPRSHSLRGGPSARGRLGGSARRRLAPPSLLPLQRRARCQPPPCLAQERGLGLAIPRTFQTSFACPWDKALRMPPQPPSLSSRPRWMTSAESTCHL